VQVDGGPEEVLREIGGDDCTIRSGRPDHPYTDVAEPATAEVRQVVNREPVVKQDGMEVQAAMELGAVLHDAGRVDFAGAPSRSSSCRLEDPAVGLASAA